MPKVTPDELRQAVRNVVHHLSEASRTLIVGDDDVSVLERWLRQQEVEEP